ncbi:MAG: lipopolysaccharide heptosyltransferase II [Limisphaerales bacterium]
MPNSEKQERIVVRGVNWLGDAVMSTPALMRLREARPDAHIALLTAAKLADLWTSHPAINEIIPFTKAEGIGSVSKRLRAGRFDRALIFPNSFRSACESWMAGIPSRIGFGGSGRNLMLTKVVARRSTDIEMNKRSAAEVLELVSKTPDKPRDRYPASGHHLHNYLHLVAELGANPAPAPPRIAVTADEITAFRTKLSLNSNLPLIALNPGAEYGPAKRWPAERFVETALQIEKAQSCIWLITGGPGDAAVGNQILTELRTKIQNESVQRIHNLAGTTSLRELCVVLAACDLVITNDTGPMHLAAAVGTSVIVPFGSTSPELTGPGLPGDDRNRLILGQAPCAPCFRRECPVDFRCMMSISPERVAEDVLSLLKRGSVHTP